MNEVACPTQDSCSPLWPVVDLRAKIDVENVKDAAALVDPEDDAIGAATGTMTTRQRREHRFAGPVGWYNVGDVQPSVLHPPVRSEAATPAE
jgi:hypothetical protein